MAERGRPEQRQAFRDGTVDHVLRYGASGLSLRPLAAALGTSDRMLLYYFSSREHLLQTVLDRIGEGSSPRCPTRSPGGSRPGALFSELWSLARAPHGEPALRLYVKILGQAAARVAPFPAAAERVAAGWLDWAHDHLDVPVDQREDTAAALLATLDGFVLLDQAVGSEVADRAARQLVHLD